MDGADLSSTGAAGETPTLCPGGGDYCGGGACCDAGSTCCGVGCCMAGYACYSNGCVPSDSLASIGVSSTTTSSTRATTTTSDTQTITTGPTPSSSPTSASGSTGAGSNNLGGGAIAGIVVGSMVFGVLVALGVFFFLRRKKTKQDAGDTGNDSDDFVPVGGRHELGSDKREGQGDGAGTGTRFMAELDANNERKVAEVGGGGLQELAANATPQELGSTDVKAKGEGLRDGLRELPDQKG